MHRRQLTGGLGLFMALNFLLLGCESSVRSASADRDDDHDSTSLAGTPADSAQHDQSKFVRGPAAAKGIAAAEKEIVRGSLKLLLYGLAAEWREDYQSILKSRYGIETEVVGGCMMMEDTVQYADAYNAQMRKAIAAKFGPYALDDAARDAEVGWKSHAPR